MDTLFVSDVHLHADRPHMVDAFTGFLGRCAGRAGALYILGDLFDIWLGDDDDTPPHPAICEALLQLTGSGVEVHVMHGNRDFLLGEGFAAVTGCRLIHDPAVIDLYGTPTLLMHGDTLCTDDAEYQAMRRQVRDPAWQQRMLALSLEQRRELGRQIREESRIRSDSKKPEIMDVTAAAVEAAMLEHGVTQLIHGHTHRPADHRLTIDGRPAVRRVLGDWYEQDSVLACGADGCVRTSAALPG